MSRWRNARWRAPRPLRRGGVEAPYPPDRDDLAYTVVPAPGEEDPGLDALPTEDRFGSGPGWLSVAVSLVMRSDGHRPRIAVFQDLKDKTEICVQPYRIKPLASFQFLAPPARPQIAAQQFIDNNPDFPLHRRRKPFESAPEIRCCLLECPYFRCMDRHGEFRAETNSEPLVNFSPVVCSATPS